MSIYIIVYKAATMIKKKTESKEIQLLREFKKETGWSYNKMGSAIGVNGMTVYNWLRGHQEPSDMAKKLIRQFILDSETK